MTTFTTEDRIKALENIKAGAEQQGDDDKEYKVIPSTTISAPNGEPYMTVMDYDKLVKIQLHKYDINGRGQLFFALDKRAVSDLIKALEKLETW